MRRPLPLPEPFHQRPFSTRAAIAAGVGEGRLRSRGLARPFHGVRIVATDAMTLWQRIRSYQQRMPQSQHFSHVTAALIHGMPLPLPHESDPHLHVAAAPGAGFPRARGTVGHQPGESGTIVLTSGCRVTSPVDTWCDLAEILSLDDLVAAGDFLITGDEPYSGLAPLATRHELGAAVAARAGRRGIRRLIAALELVRYGPLSRMETLTRLLMLRGGLPEPALNHTIVDAAGQVVAMVDLALPERRVAIEYQGDDHREKSRFRRDITRRERIEDQEWTVIYVSADDILRAPEATLARIRSRLRSRGAPV